MPDPSVYISDSTINGRLRIAYVVERVITLTMVLIVCIRAHRSTGASSGTLTVALAIGCLVIVRLAAPLWLRLLLPRDHAARAGKRSQHDAWESAALALCALAVGVSYPIGLIATVIVAVVWACIRQLSYDPLEEVPFASSGVSVPPAAIAVAESAGFDPHHIIVDDRTHAAARTVVHEFRPFILLGPHVPQTYTDREVAVIVAHELAHVKRHDVVRTRVYRLALCALAAATVMGTVRLYAGLQPGSAAVDPAAMAAGVAALALIEILCLPVLGWLSRGIERKANRWALEATGDAEAFISAMTKLHGGLGSPPEPAWWSQLIAHEHPSLGEVLIQAHRAAAEPTAATAEGLQPNPSPSRDTIAAGR